MRYFYEMYPLAGNRPQVVDDFKETEIRPQPVDDFEAIFYIPWGHNRFILDKCKSDPQKALFYVKKTLENNWSRDVLLNFLDTDLYERQGKAVTNFGHYYSGHKLKKYTDEDEYGRLEVEANCFAAQILMPEQVLNELKSRGALITVDFLKKRFGVSEEAAQKRIETMGKINYDWRSADEKLFDETILFKYKAFIDSILPKKNKATWYEDEYEMQRERDTWQLDSRSRYRY